MFTIDESQIKLTEKTKLLIEKELNEYVEHRLKELSKRSCRTCSWLADNGACCEPNPFVCYNYAKWQDKNDKPIFDKISTDIIKDVDNIITDEIITLASNESPQHKRDRQWAIDVVSDVPLDYITAREHTLLENYADRVCEALRTAPRNYKTHED